MLGKQVKLHLNFTIKTSFLNEIDYDKIYCNLQ